MSGSGLWEFRSLVLHLRDEALPGWGEAELVPWVARRPQVVRELHGLGDPQAHRHRLADEVRWGLHALSRLIEVVVGPHQPVNDDPALLDWTTGLPFWSGPTAAPSAWSALRTSLGATAIAEEAFHPFFHEVVAVQPADDPDESPSVVAEHWPGALIGGLLMMRTGVTVRAGHNVLDAVVSARSCLYWAWWRRHRLVSDLSHGWGQNSQWRTDFRRDYLVGDAVHYNVDARPADSSNDQMSAQDRNDLLRFRHSIRQDLGKHQRPYGYTMAERRP